jgi:hypothetical protein
MVREFHFVVFSPLYQFCRFFLEREPCLGILPNRVVRSRGLFCFTLIPDL